ncbi:MAG TPA: DNA methyltransferase [Turneriella sp.]|nr:DNA methyltransferase [Turneriella sp.]
MENETIVGMVFNDMDLINIKEASDWATHFLGKNITPSNISYLIQYGRIKKHGQNGSTLISRSDLKEYYSSYNGQRETNWRGKLGDDLNWALSFDQYKEAETTKHVHRLHPYKGKFIPQLVEYFLDTHVDNFKKEVFFQRGDIILDPFCGSGTTLVQASELGLNAVGIDISEFNTLISNTKITQYDILAIEAELRAITASLKEFLYGSKTLEFEQELLKELNIFNSKFFPVPDYKYRLARGEIQERKYGKEHEETFLPIYHKLIEQYNIQLRQKENKTFLDKWYTQHIRNEINFVFQKIEQVSDSKINNILKVILSRTIRSCRATTHSDLATIFEPITATYYCAKHGKICKPLFSILKWWETYSKDTIQRLIEFSRLRTKTQQVCLTGDAQTLNITDKLAEVSKEFSQLVKKQKIRGIFSSPPYVGLIDYHEQHAYAYDLFGLDRRDDFEIGRLSKGQSKEARLNYAQSISKVLLNSAQYLVKDFDVFLVANDKYNLYPTIAETANMQIVNQYKRPVLNRTEKDKGAYSEIIFHLKAK